MKYIGLFLFTLLVSPLWADNSSMTATTKVPTLAPTIQTTAAVTAQTTPLVTAQATLSVMTPLATVVPSTSATPALPKPPVLTNNTYVAPTETSTPGGERFEFQFDAGWVPAISSAAATQLGAGLDLEGRISYAIDDFFAVGLESGFYNLSFNTKALQGFGLPTGATASLNHIPLLATMQIGMGDEGGPIQPYLILAAGAAFDSYSVQGATFPPPGGASSWVNFELDPGLGVAFVVNRGMNFFVQSRLAMDFGNNTGGNTSEMADTPILFAPLQAGLNFNL